MFRDLSPTERFFEKLVTGGSSKSQLGYVNRKHDLIKQLQDKLQQMKTKVGRGGKLNNAKNMSQIRCHENTYNQPYPQIKYVV